MVLLTVKKKPHIVFGHIGSISLKPYFAIIFFGFPRIRQIMSKNTNLHKSFVFICRIYIHVYIYIFFFWRGGKAVSPAILKQSLSEL